MMKMGRLPFHGAMVRIILKGNKDLTFLFIGDTGAGKSETLEAFRTLGEDYIQDIIIVADDMGSLTIGPDKSIIGYGTEIGAFLRLDDLQPGYALGQIDRAIIMNANQVNARIIIPVTTFNTLIKGHKVDYILCLNDTDGHWPAISELIAPLGQICTIVENEKPLDQNQLKLKSAALHWEFMFTRSMFSTPDIAQQGQILKQVSQLVDEGKLPGTLSETLHGLTVENLHAAVPHHRGELCRGDTRARALTELRLHARLE